MQMVAFIYLYIFANICNNNKKSGHEFEIECETQGDMRKDRGRKGGQEMIYFK